MTTFPFRLSLAGCAIAFYLPMATLATVAPPPMKIQQHQLKNGLKIVLAEDQSRPVANLQIWYHVGSKDERPGRTGFAHLLNTSCSAAPKTSARDICASSANPAANSTPTPPSI